jgi:hypothetical protein
MLKPVLTVGTITILSFAAMAAIAYDPPPDAIAQPGDPARWYKPADTPQKLYHTAMKEAAAALKIAIDDCRQEAKADRRACVSEARRVYNDDVAAAKGLLSGSAGE